MTDKQSNLFELNHMRKKLRQYSNMDYIFINSTNIAKYNAMFNIFKEILVTGIERTYGIHRNEWLTIQSANNKPEPIIKCRSWYCFFMNSYFNVSLTVFASSIGLSKHGVKHYIYQLDEDKSKETRAKYNQILTNIFLTDAEFETGIKTYEL